MTRLDSPELTVADRGGHTHTDGGLLGAEGPTAPSGTNGTIRWLGWSGDPMTPRDLLTQLRSMPPGSLVPAGWAVEHLAGLVREVGPTGAPERHDRQPVASSTPVAPIAPPSSVRARKRTP